MQWNNGRNLDHEDIYNEMLAGNYNGEGFHWNNEYSHNSDKESDYSSDTEPPEMRTRNKQVASTDLLATCTLLASCFAYSFTLNMEAVQSSKISRDVYQTIHHYIPEDSTLRSYKCENLKSKIINLGY